MVVNLTNKDSDGIYGVDKYNEFTQTEPFANAIQKCLPVMQSNQLNITFSN